MIDNRTSQLRSQIAQAVVAGLEQRRKVAEAAAARQLEQAARDNEYISRRVERVLAALPEQVASVVANMNGPNLLCHIAILEANEVGGLRLSDQFRCVPVLVTPRNLRNAAAVIYERLVAEGLRPLVVNSFPPDGDWRRFCEAPHMYLSLKLSL